MPAQNGKVRLRGVVVGIHPTHGDNYYGFIDPDDRRRIPDLDRGDDIFFHSDDCEEGVFLSRGDVVEFDDAVITRISGRYRVKACLVDRVMAQILP